MERTAEKVAELYISRKGAYAERNGDIQTHRNLFDGAHWTEPLSNDEAVAEDAFQLVVNYCRATVLHFVGALAGAPRFRVPRPSGDPARQAKAEVREWWLAGLRDSLLRAWSDCEMDASKTRCGVLQVLWDPDASTKDDVFVGNPFVFRAIDPALFYPCYRTLDRSDDFFYVIREDPDRLIEDLEERYGVTLQATDSEQGTEGTCTVIEYWDKDDYHVVALTTQAVQHLTPRGRPEVSYEEVYTTLQKGSHGYPRIPFFVLQNIRNAHEDPTYRGSLSDVEAIADLNKHLDWLLSENAEEILLQVHRPLIYKSDSPMKQAHELVAAPGAVFDIGADEMVDALGWPPQPEMVRQHYLNTRSAINDMSFIPATAQGDLPAGASGMSMGIANTPLQRILELKKPRRIDALKAIAAFLLQMAEAKGAPIVVWCATSSSLREEAKLTKDLVDGDYYVDITWRNMLPRDEIAYEAHQAYLLKAGAQTLGRTLDNLGVEWVESEKEELLREYIDPIINPDRARQYVDAQRSLKTLEAEREPQPQAQPVTGPQPQPQFPPQLQAQPPSGQPPTGPVQTAPPGALPVRPPVPSFQGMALEGRLTPFGPREMFGAGSLPLRPQGPGVNVGLGGQ